MNALDKLRRLIEVADPDGTVTVRWLAAVVEDGAPTYSPPRSAGDLTLEEVCEAVKKKPSTVRGWLGRKELRGYKLNGKAWRIPRAALAEYLARQADRAGDSPEEDEVDIAAWRSGRSGPQ